MKTIKNRTKQSNRIKINAKTKLTLKMLILSLTLLLFFGYINKSTLATLHFEVYNKEIFLQEDEINKKLIPTNFKSRLIIDNVSYISISDVQKAMAYKTSFTLDKNINAITLYKKELLIPEQILKLLLTLSIFAYININYPKILSSIKHFLFYKIRGSYAYRARINKSV